MKGALKSAAREPKSLSVALNIAGVEKIRLENLRLRSTLEDIRFEV